MIAIVFMTVSGMGKNFIGFYDLSEAVYWSVGCVVWVVLFYEEGVAGFYFFC